MVLGLAACTAKPSARVSDVGAEKPGLAAKRDSGPRDTGKMSDAKVGSADEGFHIELDGRASIAARRIPLKGMLRVYVAVGSQYAMWRQFPSSMRFEVETPHGDIGKSMDLSMSISDDSETYERYAREPANQVVGKGFEIDAFDKISSYVDKPGIYRIRAEYEGILSNWIEIDVGE